MSTPKCVFPTKEELFSQPRAFAVATERTNSGLHWPVFFLFKYALVHHAVVGLIKKEQRFFLTCRCQNIYFPNINFDDPRFHPKYLPFYNRQEKKSSDPPRLHLHSSVKPWTWININNIFAVSNTFESGLFSCFQKWPLKGASTNSQRIV